MRNFKRGLVLPVVAALCAGAGGVYAGDLAEPSLKDVPAGGAGGGAWTT